MKKNEMKGENMVNNMNRNVRNMRPGMSRGAFLRNAVVGAGVVGASMMGMSGVARARYTYTQPNTYNLGVATAGDYGWIEGSRTELAVIGHEVERFNKENKNKCVINMIPIDLGCDSLTAAKAIRDTTANAIIGYSCTGEILGSMTLPSDIGYDVPGPDFVWTNQDFIAKWSQLSVINVGANGWEMEVLSQNIRNMQGPNFPLNFRSIAWSTWDIGQGLGWKLVQDFGATSTKKVLLLTSNSPFSKGMALGCKEYLASTSSMQCTTICCARNVPSYTNALANAGSFDILVLQPFLAGDAPKMYDAIVANGGAGFLNNRPVYATYGGVFESVLETDEGQVFTTGITLMDGFTPTGAEKDLDSPHKTFFKYYTTMINSDIFSLINPDGYDPIEQWGGAFYIWSFIDSARLMCEMLRKHNGIISDINNDLENGVFPIGWLGSLTFNGNAFLVSDSTGPYYKVFSGGVVTEQTKISPSVIYPPPLIIPSLSVCDFTY